MAQIRAEKARRRLSAFIRAAWHVVEPATPYVHGWHIDAICEHLEAVSSGEIRNLLINMPPRHAKSLIVSVFWPAWEWIEHPERRWLFASYAQPLSTRDSLRCRRLVQSPWYLAHFGDSFKLTSDQNAKIRFENDRTGYRLATSVGGEGTGEGGDRIVTDDPHNVTEAESDTVRSGTITWWDETMSTRGNDPKTVARVIVMQRVHQSDLSGHVLEKGGYEHLCLPAEYDGRRSVTSIGWRDPRTVSGELLWPAQFGRVELERLKIDLGSRASAGQLQQSPTAAQGSIFHAEWFAGRYTRFSRIVEAWTCWDTAIKAAEENDETACTVAARGVDGNCYILRVAHGRWETPDVARMLIAQAREYRELFGDAYRGDYIEDKVSGSTLIQYVRREAPELALIGVRAESDKIARAQGVTPICEAGRVLLPDINFYPNTTRWVSDLIEALRSFGPSAKHDDIADSFVYTVKKFVGTLGVSGGMRRGRGGGAV